jgi:hypothetical protein
LEFGVGVGKGRREEGEGGGGMLARSLIHSLTHSLYLGFFIFDKIVRK